MEHSLVWNKNKLNLVQEMLSEYVDDQTILANLPIWCNLSKFWINRDQNVSDLKPFDYIKWIHQRKNWYDW